MTIESLYLSRKPISQTISHNPAQSPLHYWSWPTETALSIPILMFHGFTGSGRDFAWIFEHLPGSLKGLAPDLVGHDAFPPKEVDAYRMQNEAPKLYEAFGKSQSEGYVLLGYSMGGRLALYYALQFPENIKGLVLVGASPGLSTEQERKVRQQLDQKLAEKILSIGLEAFLEEWSQKPIIASQSNIHSGFLEQMRQQKRQLKPEGLANSLRGMGTGEMPNLWDALPSLHIPTLLITGEHDAKFHGIAGKMVKALPHAIHQIIPDVGHAAHLEDPETFANLFMTFYQQVTTGCDQG